VENFVRGDIIPPHSDSLGNKRRPFTAVHFGSPSGGYLVVHCNFNGFRYNGHRIPTEILSLLANVDIMVIQFGMELVMEVSRRRSRSNWVEAKNLAMLAYPQPELEVAHMKSGISFVALMLDAPSGIFSVQTRDRHLKKNRRDGLPVAASVPIGIPNHRYNESGRALYTEQERQERREYFDSFKDANNIAIDYDVDDFSKTGKSFSTRMYMYIAHAHCIPNALIWRMVHRAAVLHGISLQADAVRFAQYLLLSLREVENFKHATTPSEKGCRPLGNFNWLTTESSRPDTPFIARPFLATPGYNPETHSREIGQLVGKRKHRFAVDPMGLTTGFRRDLENLNGGKMDDVDLDHLILVQFQRQKCRPHRCMRCGSGNHQIHACLTSPDTIRCIYPRCLSEDHVLAVCPKVIQRCTTCQKLGHSRDDHDILYPALINDFLAAAPFHGLAIFTCERLSVAMSKQDGEFVVLPTVDFSNDKYFSENDRRKLSTLTYDIPY
jgi:hypothetical protein